jgi:hypothetical protein
MSALLLRAGRAALRALDFLGVRLIDDGVVVRIDDELYIVAKGSAAREAMVADSVEVLFESEDDDDAVAAWIDGAGVFVMPAPKGLPS